MKRAGDKITVRETLAAQLQTLHKEGGRSGFTSGSFDLLHAGHVDYLEQARSQCDLLVVGINSDSSVREYKDPRRPICPEGDRALVVAGLSCVDHVFLFQELNNNRNIEVLQPSIYFKAGDYSKAQLSSAAIVESYGGSVQIIPFLPGHSTTGIIERVLEAYQQLGVEGGTAPDREKRPAVFLDRDGTINSPVEYLHEPEKFVAIKGALEAMKRFQDAGYGLVVVTNQPGIGLGYFQKEDLFRVNKEFLRQATAAGVKVDKIYFCPHSKAAGCTCRKPLTAMIDRAVEELNLDLSKSIVIGDATSDVMLARNAGCKAVLVRTGLGGSDKIFDVAPDLIVEDLADAAKALLG